MGSREYEDPDNFYHKQIIPPREIEYTSEAELVMEGNSVRHQHVPQTWIANGNALKKTPELRVWTKDHSKHLYANGGSGRDEPQGGIAKSGSVFGLHTPNIRPLLSSMRPASKPFVAYDLDKMIAAPKADKIRGRPCIQFYLTEQVHQGTYRLSLWYDKERDYCLVREIESINGTIVSQMDVDYEMNQTVGWFPARWSWSRRINLKGAIDWTFRAEGVRAEFNQTLSPALFDIQFPNGTDVIDNVSNTMYTVRPTGQEVFYSRSSPLTAGSSRSIFQAVYVWVVALLVGIPLVLLFGRWVYLRFRKPTT